MKTNLQPSVSSHTQMYDNSSWHSSTTLKVALVSMGLFFATGAALINFSIVQVPLSYQITQGNCILALCGMSTLSMVAFIALCIFSLRKDIDHSKINQEEKIIQEWQSKLNRSQDYETTIMDMISSLSAADRPLPLSAIAHLIEKLGCTEEERKDLPEILGIHFYELLISNYQISDHSTGFPIHQFEVDCMQLFGENPEWQTNQLKPSLIEGIRRAFICLAEEHLEELLKMAKNKEIKTDTPIGFGITFKLSSNQQISSSSFLPVLEILKDVPGLVSLNLSQCSLQKSLISNHFFSTCLKISGLNLVKGTYDPILYYLIQNQRNLHIITFCIEDQLYQIGWSKRTRSIIIENLLELARIYSEKSASL